MSTATEKRSRRGVWRAAAGLMVLVGSILAGAGEARAHASLIASVPAYGSTLTEAPKTVQLQFDNPIEPGLVKVRLKVASTEVELGKGVLVGDRTPRAAVEFTLPEHEPGEYYISWITYAFDGHVVSGTIPYTFDPNGVAQESAGESETTGTAVADPGSSNRIIDIVEIQLRFLNYLGLAAFFGGVVWMLVLRREGEGAGVLLDTARKAVAGGALAAAFFAIARGGTAVWRMLDGGFAIGEAVPQLLDGQIGGYILAGVLFAVAGSLGHRATGQTTLWVAATASSCAAMLTAGLGHAAGKTAPGIGAVLMGAHLTAAALWVGSVGLLAYVATESRFKSVETRWSELRSGLDQLGKILITAFVVLAVSGMRAAYVYADGVPGGTWGMTLGAKLVLVAGAGGIGLVHYLRGKRGAGLSGKTLAIEATLLVLTLTAAAVLSVSVPA